MSMKAEVALDAYDFPILSATALKRARKLLNWRVVDLTAKTRRAVT